MGNYSENHYRQIAQASRRKVLELIFRAQTSHIGSNFSVADIMAVLFENFDFKKDQFVLSAGWKAAMLYYHMWRKGMIMQEELDSYCQPGSKWIGLAEPVHPFIKFAGGSMGMGLAAGVGLAWSKKQRGEDGTVYVLESDGGMQVGITWEAIMFAAKHELDNLVLIIDNNGFQAMGKVDQILKVDGNNGNDDQGESLNGKFYSFGWNTERIQGHKFIGADSLRIFEKDYEWYWSRNNPKVPTVIIANTIKGKGVSWMENNNLWHYAQIKKDDYEKALVELNA